MPSIAFLAISEDLRAATESWQSWLLVERRMAKNTVEAYTSDLAFFLSFLVDYRGGACRLETLSLLSLTDFRAWLAHLARGSLETASRARALASVRSFFRWLDRTGRLHNTAIELLRAPKTARRLPRPVTETQAKEIIDHLSRNEEDWTRHRDEALFTLLYGAGLRISEALSLTHKDFAHGDHVIVRGKGGKQRIVPLLPIVRQTIEKYLRTCPFAAKDHHGLFLGARGDILNPGVAQRSLRQVRRELGLPETLTPHALRHSFATHLLASGADLRSLQELLGHRSLSTTQLYTRIESVQLAEVYRASHPRAKKKQN